MNEVTSLFWLFLFLLSCYCKEFDNFETNWAFPPGLLKNWTLPESEYQFLKYLADRAPTSWNFIRQRGWNFANASSINPCIQAWYGVRVEYSLKTGHCHLCAIALPNLQFNRTLPPIIENFPELTYIDLSKNQFSGKLPKFRNVPSLSEIYLHDNRFTGSIPSDMFDVESDQFIRLNLTKLNLGMNLLIGTIPPCFYQLKALKELNLGYNHLSGTISDEFLFLPSLSYLSLHDNQFYGGIPSIIVQMKTLESLDLSNNFLSGTISLDVFPKNLISFFIESNNFHGTFPNLFIRSNFVANYVIISNYFIGTIPNSICETLLNSANRFSVSYNHFSGTLPSCLLTKFPPALIEVNNNDLSGKLQLNGEKRAQFTGFIAFGHNRFTGTFPVEMFQTFNVRAISFSNNCFKGGFENFDCSNMKMRSMNYIDLDSLYSSERCVSRNDSFVTSLARSLDSFGGPLPFCLLRSFRSLRDVSMAGNGFTGSLPKDLQIADGIQSLNLSHNRLVGEIPSWMQSRKFRSLDLSFNKLEGNIQEMVKTAAKRRFVNNSNFFLELNGMTESVVVYEQLVLKHNRLSGRLFSTKGLDDTALDWSILRNLSRLEVLEGNVFECREGEREREGEEFRLAIENDWYESRYFCESSVVEVGLKAYGYLVGLLIGLALFFIIMLMLQKVTNFEGLMGSISATIKINFQKILTFISWKGKRRSTSNDNRNNVDRGEGITTDFDGSNVVPTVLALDRMIVKSTFCTACLALVVLPVFYFYIKEKEERTISMMRFMNGN